MGKRVIARRRGHGGVYKSPSHRHKGAVLYPKEKEFVGKVTDIIHDPGKTVPVAEVTLSNGGKMKLLASEGMQIDQIIAGGPDVKVEKGNVMPLGKVPEGTLVYNLESIPGDGGKFVRAGGTSAIVVSQGEKTVVQLPSGSFRSFDPKCRATIGVLAGGGRGEKPFGKAGKKWHATRSTAQVYPKVRGVAMNPVDHPHGGGAHQHVGRKSTVSRHAPPGKKVGRLSPKKKKANK